VVLALSQEVAACTLYQRRIPLPGRFEYCVEMPSRPKMLAAAARCGTQAIATGYAIDEIGGAEYATSAVRPPYLSRALKVHSILLEQAMSCFVF
jgi:hypothetical protein